VDLGGLANRRGIKSKSCDCEPIFGFLRRRAQYALLGDGAVCVRSTRPKDFRSIPNATGGIARLACARLRELGKDVKAVLSKAGLRPEEADDPTVRLEVRTQIKFLELAAEELRDDFLGFHLARSFDLREIGLVYYVIASSEQLADALRKAERYSRIVWNGGHRSRLRERRPVLRSASDGVLAGYADAYMPTGHRQPTSGAPIESQAFSGWLADGIQILFWD
jgi:Arabinose-binding domain of AraC transcription regulator, N-term